MALPCSTAACELGSQPLEAFLIQALELLQFVQQNRHPPRETPRIVASKQVRKVMQHDISAVLLESCSFAVAVNTNDQPKPAGPAGFHPG